MSIAGGPDVEHLEKGYRDLECPGPLMLQVCLIFDMSWLCTAVLEMGCSYLRPQGMWGSGCPAMLGLMVHQTTWCV